MIKLLKLLLMQLDKKPLKQSKLQWLKLEPMRLRELKLPLKLK
jgi:hypothetical protein